MIANNTANAVRRSVAQLTNRASQTMLLICVKYGADEETSEYLESVRGLRGQENLRVLVVDNTIDGRPPQLLTRDNYATIHAPANLGYFGGARYGLSLYLQHNSPPDWVAISNVDLVISDREFLTHLAQLSHDPRIGVVAPSIRSTLTGKDQNPYLRARPTAARMHMYKWLYRSRLILNTYELAAAAFHRAHSASLKLKASSVDEKQNLPETIYAPHGSFMILSNNYFARGGDLQFPGFLFGEEIYIAESIRRLGLEVVYEPSLQVLHNEHQSTKLFKSRKVAAYAASSAEYCADTFFPLHSS
jgi:GT2 family glycosyltransferase